VENPVESESSTSEQGEGETTGIESLEDIEAEDHVSSEIASEDTTETADEIQPEPFPEETELYPVEQEPHDSEII
jgi:hypothetical protein